MTHEDKNHFLNKYLHQTNNTNTDNDMDYNKKSKNTYKSTESNEPKQDRNHSERKLQNISIIITKVVAAEIPPNKIAFNILTSMSKLVKA